MPNELKASLSSNFPLELFGRPLSRKEIQCSFFFFRIPDPKSEEYSLTFIFLSRINLICHSFNQHCKLKNRVILKLYVCFLRLHFFKENDLHFFLWLTNVNYFTLLFFKTVLAGRHHACANYQFSLFF